MNDVELSALGLSGEETGRVLSAAQAAPSLDNSQPWWIAPVDGGFEVCTDAERAAPAADPVGRQRVISTGAALYNLRLALRVVGRQPDTELFPDPTRPGLVARVTVRPGPPATPEERRLAAAIVWRRTWRAPFSPVPVPPRVLAQLATEALQEGAMLLPVATVAGRDRLADLFVAAVADQLADPARAAEQLDWLRLNPAEDGIPLRNIAAARYPIPGLPTPDPLAGPDDWRAVVRGLAYRDALVLLATASDAPRDWVVAGCALQRVLLTATRYGLATGFLNQPVESEPLRQELSAVLGTPDHPQMLLRLGFPDGPRPPATPRRAVTRRGPR
jgi:hypothetical protein